MVQALLFGSIGVVIESSDLQRRAYNQALQEAGLPWVWDRETYADLLTQSGGKDRLAHLAAATGTALSEAAIDQIHARKTELACAAMAAEALPLRPGVAELMALARARGLKLGFVTSTYQANVDAVFARGGADFAAAHFGFIGARDMVRRSKPAPDIYLLALERLGMDAADALAIEDTAASVMAAKRAGITTVATPGALTATQDFWQADLLLDSLSTGHGLDPRLLHLIG